MLISKLVGERTKNSPSDATIVSHSLMVRAGYIKLVSNGIWSLATPALRACHKIEQIIREEMDKVDGQEVLFPVVMPKELWAESGRYFSIGDEMVRFKDRCGRDMVLGMTHEEAAVHFVRDAVSSYNQLPFMIYQIQTKFRDEARSRGGLIRVREFTMKDAYSFHVDNDDLEKYYKRVYDAYVRIFKRIGMKRVVAVKSDSGLMGGNIAHEYMLLTDVGEDTIAICPQCGYKANMEIATTTRKTKRDEISEEMQEIFTGEAKEIEEVCAFLNVPKEKTMKAVVYCVKGSDELIAAFIRGDLEVNEAKLKKAVGGKDIVPANLNEDERLVVGNIGAYQLESDKTTVLYDISLENCNNLVIGANKKEYHITGVDMKRDFPNAAYVDISKVQKGDACPICGHPLDLENGIEVGNIFQLGTKYTKAMNMTVLNKEGKAVNPIMGCYGIGVGRALASVIEESHDEKGIILPMSIAPWQAYICVLRPDDENVYNKSVDLYNNLEKNGVEVILDDRKASPGVKFSDCDLMGIPIRIVVSPRSLEKGVVELQTRDKEIQEECNYSDCLVRVKQIIDLKK